jgi:hypothetical protein
MPKPSCHLVQEIQASRQCDERDAVKLIGRAGRATQWAHAEARVPMGKKGLSLPRSLVKQKQCPA